MMTFLAIGTVWFWLLVAAESVALLALVSAERVGWATLSVVVTLLLVRFLGGSELFLDAIRDPLPILLGIAGYAALGALWAIGKWWFFVRRVRERYDEIKREFLAERGYRDKYVQHPIPEELRAEWKDRLGNWRPPFDKYSRLLGALKGPVPQPSDHKDRILIWMMYWPWSLLGTLIDDPVRKLFQAVYRGIHAMLKRISESVFKGVDEDLRVPPPPEKGGTPAKGDGHAQHAHAGPERVVRGDVPAATVDDMLAGSATGHLEAATVDDMCGEPTAGPKRDPAEGHLESIGCVASGDDTGKDQVFPERFRSR